jgi:hypothetical protein
MKNNNKKKADSDLKFKEVLTVWGPVETEVVRTLLEDHGIRIMTRGQVVQSVTPFSADGLGKIKILVAEEDLESAKKIIEEHQQNKSDL